MVLRRSRSSTAAEVGVGLKSSSAGRLGGRLPAALVGAAARRSDGKFVSTGAGSSSSGASSKAKSSTASSVLSSGVVVVADWLPFSPSSKTNSGSSGASSPTLGSYNFV